MHETNQSTLDFASHAAQHSCAFVRRLVFALACLSAGSLSASEPGDAPQNLPVAAESREHESNPAEPATPSAAAATEETKVDFFVDIQPLLTMYCVKCHGPGKRSGGLRLDSRDFAQAGGDSGKPILGATVETNELLARVASQDRTYRMPKNAPPLDDAQIARVRQWVAEGTPWSSPISDKSQGAPKPFYEDALLWAARITDRYKQEFEYAKPFALAFLAVQLALAAIARAGAAHAAGRAWTTGKARWFCQRARTVNGRELVLAWCLSVALFAIVLQQAHQQRTSSELARTMSLLNRVESPWSRTIYGSPPVPIRFDQPKQLSGTYYRGNCERNPKLFNNGNYLTAVFRIGLCDVRHEALQFGSPIPSDGVFVRVEIERAPGTSEMLFSKELMASVFLSEQFVPEGLVGVEKPFTRLETLEADQRWAAYVPIELTPESETASGLIYVNTGRIENGQARGQPHYGIKYDLVCADGRLTSGSDLWMNSFGNSTVALPEPPGKIPYREWFDNQPIPPIEGENSKDPKLLGVDEYVRKGLIKPPVAPQGGSNPAESESGQPGVKESGQGNQKGE